MSFLTFFNANRRFAEKELVWRCYTIAKTLPNIKEIELIGNREFIAEALDKNEETFVTHVLTLLATQTMKIYSI